MLRLLALNSFRSGLRSIPYQLTRFASAKANHANPSNDEIDPEKTPLIHPDWYRYPQKTDDPRQITPGYPDLPFESYQNRDPYKHYDDQQYRRNFGEPLPEDYDILNVSCFDIENTFSIRYMLTGIFIAGATFYGVVQFISLFNEWSLSWRLNAAPSEGISIPPPRRVWKPETSGWTMPLPQRDN